MFILYHVFESELGQNLPTHSLLCIEWKLYSVLMKADEWKYNSNKTPN
jgi:hypothetical protein